MPQNPTFMADLMDGMGQFVRDTAGNTDRINTLSTLALPLTDAGTAFPTSGIPTGLRFFRSDLLKEFVYDGTRWLGEEVPLQGVPWVSYAQPFTANSTILEYGVPYGYLVTYFGYRASVATTNSSVSYWTISLKSGTTAGATATIATDNTATDTAGAYATHTLISETVGTPTVVASSAANMQIEVAKGGTTGTPGNLFIIPTILIRRIAT